MNKLLLTTLLFSALNSVSAQRDEFASFDAYSMTFDEWYSSQSPTTHSDDTISVEPLEMGNLITWKQYKEFLSEVKRMKGEFTYAQLLPILSENHLINCLTTKRFDSSPVVGVSWTNAHEYCKWRMIVDNKSNTMWEDPKTAYRLPTRSEWISAYQQSSESGFKIDLNSDYSDWTLTTYDESMNGLHDYRYIAQKTDPPAMKRKRVIGSSFFIPNSNYLQNSFGYYQDSSYSHIGFRLIREKDVDLDTDMIDTYLGDYFEETWGRSDEYYEAEVVISEEFKTYFNQIDDRMTGSYVSYYPNGQQKSKGFYYKNQRIGKWTVWDSLGNKIIERNYLSPYRFEQLFPETKDEQAIILRDAQMIDLSRNSSGRLNYPHVQERSVLWSRRLWTRIDPTGNEQLFYKNRLIEAIELDIESGSLRPYDTLTDQFTATISPKEFATRLSGAVVAYIVKEDCFYDFDRGQTFTRPIGICPVVMDTINGTPVEHKLAWIYFPELRETLGTIQCFTSSDLIMNASISTYNRGGTSSTTLDDLFFYRDFNRRIVGTISVRGKLEVLDEASQEEAVELIETEHDIWIQLYSK